MIIINYGSGHNKKIVRYLRWGLLTLFVVLVSIAAYLHQVNGGAKSPSIHALCPFGGLESLYTFFTAGSFVSKIFAGTMILFFITLVLAVIFRRSFCGLICPFGAIQEFFSKVGVKLSGKKFIMPSSIDSPLRYLKYLILIVTVLYAWRTAGLWMAPYDPWSAYAHLPEGLESVWESSAIGLLIFIITLIGSVIYDRFFCKYLCPMGAMYAIIGKVSPYRVSRDEKVCTECGKCNKVCPVNIDVQHSQEVRSAECINCQSCVLNCPKPGALNIKQGRRNFEPATAIMLVMFLFFGSIFAAQSAGVYKLIPEEIEAGKTINIQEIKGYMTIKEASELTGLELDEIYKKLKIPKSVPKEAKFKEIQKLVPEYSFDKAKSSI